jgi:transposase-like protein
MKVVVSKKDGGEGAGETEGARRATGGFPAGAPAAEVPALSGPDTEVVAKAQRRRFTAEYKRRIVREADRCTTAGAIGALLRREGLYSSHLTTWRAARDRGELEGLSAKKRGPKVVAPDPRDKKIAELEREVGRQSKRAERAEALVEVQKKLAALLGTPFESEK